MRAMWSVNLFLDLVILKILGEKYKLLYDSPYWVTFDPLSRDSSVGIVTGYGLEYGAEVPVTVRSRTFSSPRRPDRLWGPPDLLSNGYREIFPRG
jgi:hypothetical protein